MASRKPRGSDNGGSFLVRNRVKVAQIVALLLLPVLLFVHHSWPEGSYLDFALDTVGYILLMSGVLGRLWCTLYIGGKKQSTLQRSGPYSLVRHPLYVSSLLLGLGVSALSENPIVLGMVILYFIWQYTTTIRYEEAVLAKAFEERYRDYMRDVPCFLPSLSSYDATPPENIDLNALRSEALRSVVTLSLIPMLGLLALLHEKHILPYIKFP